MNNIQIKHKMAFGILLHLSLLICICILAINMMHTIEKGVTSIYNDRVVPLEDLKVIADDYAVFVIDAINKANAGDFSAEQAKQALTDARLVSFWWSTSKFQAEKVQQNITVAQSVYKLILLGRHPNQYLLSSTFCRLLVLLQLNVLVE